MIGVKNEKTPSNTFLFGGKVFSSLRPFVQFNTQVHKYTATVQRLTHQMSKMPTVSELLPLKILAHIFHAIALLIHLTDPLLGNAVGGCCHEGFCQLS